MGWHGMGSAVEQGGRVVGGRVMLLSGAAGWFGTGAASPCPHLCPHPAKHANSAPPPFRIHWLAALPPACAQISQPILHPCTCLWPACKWRLARKAKRKGWIENLLGELGPTASMDSGSAIARGASASTTAARAAAKGERPAAPAGAAGQAVRFRGSTPTAASPLRRCTLQQEGRGATGGAGWGWWGGVGWNGAVGAGGWRAGE